MIWATSAIKLYFREIPESKDYAFVNVSYDLDLIDKTDDFVKLIKFIMPDFLPEPESRYVSQKDLIKEFIFLRKYHRP